MRPDLAGDHAATGEGTAPVAHGAAGPPLQQHQESSEMIYGRQEGGGADEREGTAGGPGEGSGTLRSGDATTGAGPYMDPAEDLERHGATSGLAASGSPGSWSGISMRYREHWQSRQSAGGDRWEEAEPAYRYGYEMASDPRYRGREWNDVETDLRSGYAGWSRDQGHPEVEDESVWERIKGMARHAWDTARSAGGGGRSDRPE